MKKMFSVISLVLAAALSFGCFSSCGVTRVTSSDEPSLPTATPVQESEWSLEGLPDAPDATPATDPADGVKVQYRCEPANGGSINGKATQYIVPGGYCATVTAMPFYGYRFVGWSDGTETRSRYGDKVTGDTVYTACFERITDIAEIVVPDICLTTDSGSPISGKTYVGASVSISGSGKAAYDLQNARVQTKCRGNSTYDSKYITRTLGEERWASVKKRYEKVGLLDLYTAKNSYSLKFDTAVNLLGIGNGKNRDWILQANKFDVTQLRNKMIYLLAESMGTFGWVAHCTWANLYINGEYRGLYMVQEKVEAAKDRIDLNDAGTDPDKDYLVELDFRVDKDTSKTEGLDYFKIPEFHKNDANAREFDIVSEHSTTQECDFIRDYLIGVDAAIRSHDRAKIEACVDLHSMVDIFIIEELVKDCDWGATSFYMCKRKGDDHLYFVSPWDFDLTMGSYSSSLTITGIISHATYGNEWFEELHNQPWFIEMVRARMNSLEDDLNRCLDTVYSYAQALRPYADQNDELWQLYGVNYHEYVSPQVSGLLFTYDEHVGFIHDWALYRWAEIRKYYPARSKSPYQN